MGPVQARILDYMRRHGRGRVFTCADFVHLEFGARDAVDQALSRLVRSRDLSRLGRGLYHRPRLNRQLGITVGPSADDVALALARKTGHRISPSGAVAANRLGLSPQVPAQAVYVTDGRTRQIRVGKTVFQVKHVSPKVFPNVSATSALVFLALEYLGRNAIDDELVSRLRRALSLKDRKRLLGEARYTKSWIADAARRVAAPTDPMKKAAAHG